MPKTIGAAVLAVAFIASGCGGDSGTEAAPATTREPTTTTTTTPEDAFLADVADKLTTDDPEGLARSSLDLAQSVCDGLATNRGVYSDDAAADSAQTDAVVVATADSLLIASALSGDAPDEAIAVVLRTGGEHLCPEYLVTINDLLAQSGL